MMADIVTGASLLCGGDSATLTRAPVVVIVTVVVTTVTYGIGNDILTVN